MRLFLAFIFFTSSVNAQNHEKLLDSLMKAHATVRNFNGNVLVAKNGNIIYQKSFGFRNYDTKEPLDNNSIFDLASVSKQFTAMGILLLKKERKLELTDSLRKFFPELPYQNITIKHLLTHTSGLPDYMEIMDAIKWNQKKIAFNKDMIDVLATAKTQVLFPPGSKWEYSNTAYVLLASIIEKVSGEPFAVFMKEKVFVPLGLNHTRVYNTRRSSNEIIPNYAYGFVYDKLSQQYKLPDSIPALNFVYYLDGIQGDGIINSTTGDLLNWDRALKGNKLLSPDLQAEMLSSQATIDSANKRGYGYGVMVSEHKHGKSISHSGGWPGYTTFLRRDVDDDITYVVLSNNNSHSEAIANQLASVMYNEEVQFPYIHKEVIIDTAKLDKFIGIYQGTNKIVIIKKDGKLFRKGNPDIQLKPESETKFFYADESDRMIEFKLDVKGKVEKAWFIGNGVKIEMKKTND